MHSVLFEEKVLLGYYGLYVFILCTVYKNLADRGYRPTADFHKVLLEHSPVIYPHALWLLPHLVGLVEWLRQRLYGHRPEVPPIWPLKELLLDPCDVIRRTM